jgi:hypothetical protein
MIPLRYYIAKNRLTTWLVAENERILVYGTALLVAAFGFSESRQSCSVFTAVASEGTSVRRSFLRLSYVREKARFGRKACQRKVRLKTVTTHPKPK